MRTGIDGIRNTSDDSNAVHASKAQLQVFEGMRYAGTLIDRNIDG